MPQIWMTYYEIAGMVGCDFEQARCLVASRSLDRKKSRDGKTRVKLDLMWTALFIEKVRDTDRDLDRAIADLRRVHRDMAREDMAREDMAREQPAVRSA